MDDARSTADRAVETDLSVDIEPRRILRWFLTISVVLFVIHCLATYMAVEHHIRGRGLVDVVNLGVDTAAPTWFASFLLMSSSVGLLAVARHSRHFDPPNVRYWLGLSGLFLLLSIDEVAAIHEWGGDLELFGETSGVLAYQWVILGIAFAVGVFAAYLPFLLRLDRRTALLFVASGAVFLGGALLIEMMNAALQANSPDGEGGLRYGIQTGVEELFELVGASLFVYSVLDVLVRRRVSIAIAFHHAG